MPACASHILTFKPAITSISTTLLFTTSVTFPLLDAFFGVISTTRVRAFGMGGGYRCVRGLRAAGIKKGDRVAGVMTNSQEALVFMLGTTAVGAIWRYVKKLHGIFHVYCQHRVDESAALRCENRSRLSLTNHSSSFLSCRHHPREHQPIRTPFRIYVEL